MKRIFVLVIALMAVGIPSFASEDLPASISLPSWQTSPTHWCSPDNAPERGWRTLLQDGSSSTWLGSPAGGPAVIPEPSGMLALLVGVTGLGGLVLRHRR